MSERVQLTTEQATAMLPDGELLDAWVGAQRGGRMMEFTHYRRAHLISLVEAHGASTCYGQSGFQVWLPNGDYLQVDTKREAKGATNG